MYVAPSKISFPPSFKIESNNVQLKLLTATITFLIFLNTVREVQSHGRLIEPPSRASAWRYGFNTPPNYNDHELFCGGFTRQWNKNDGKCGVCGDAWDSKIPRLHEFGGKYGQGVIVRKYETGAVIPIRVELTANHHGYFEFNICPDYKNATQDCLDQHQLSLARPQENVAPNPTRYFPMDGNRIYEMRYTLPSNFTCEHCMLQWRYIAGNNWGTCADGTGAVGCGPQEEFRACADIQIGDKSEVPMRPVVPTRRPGLKPTVTTTSTPELPTEGPHVVVEPEPMDNIWIGFLMAFIGLICVVISLIVIYIYYYYGGKTFKRWLKTKTTREKPQPPVKPPRTKKLQRQSSDLSITDLKTESLA